MCSAFDCVANFRCNRKLDRPDQVAVLQQPPEIAEIRQRCPAGGALQQEMADPSAKRPSDRDHPDRMAGEDGFGEHGHAVGGHVDFVALTEQHGEAWIILHQRIRAAGHQALEEPACLRPRARTDRDHEATGRRLALQGHDCLAKCVMIELPMARRAADGDEAPRARMLSQPLLLCRVRRRGLSGIADRKGELNQVADRVAGILRRRDLKVEIVKRSPGIADVNQLRPSAAALADIACDRDTAVAASDNQVWPGRSDERTRAAGNRGQPAPQPRNASELVEGDLFGFERIAERLGEREQLVVVADARPHQQPDQRRAGRCRDRLSRDLRGGEAARHRPRALEAPSLPAIAVGAPAAASTSS